MCTCVWCPCTFASLVCLLACAFVRLLELFLRLSLCYSLAPSASACPACTLCLRFGPCSQRILSAPIALSSKLATAAAPASPSGERSAPAQSSQVELSKSYFLEHQGFGQEAFSDRVLLVNAQALNSESLAVAPCWCPQFPNSSEVGVQPLLRSGLLPDKFGVKSLGF